LTFSEGNYILGSPGIKREREKERKLMEHNTGRPESENPDDFSPEYKTGFRDGWDSIESQIKSAIETYEAVIFVCNECGKLAYIDPGDGLITHID
jgi:hypothetical protein